MTGGFRLALSPRSSGAGVGRRGIRLPFRAPLCLPGCGCGCRPRGQAFLVHGVCRACALVVAPAVARQRLRWVRLTGWCLTQSAWSPCLSGSRLCLEVWALLCQPAFRGIPEELTVGLGEPLSGCAIVWSAPGAQGSGPSSSAGETVCREASLLPTRRAAAGSGNVGSPVSPVPGPPVPSAVPEAQRPARCFWKVAPVFWF